jgi:hypothetical protein
MDTPTLHEALAIAEAADTPRAAAAALRERLPALRVVVVDAFDMRDEKPAAHGLRRQLHLGASDGHCWAVTEDLAKATGLFVSDRQVP